MSDKETDLAFLEIEFDEGDESCTFYDNVDQMEEIELEWEQNKWISPYIDDDGFIVFKLTDLGKAELEFYNL